MFLLVPASEVEYWSCVSSWVYTLITILIAFYAYRAYAISQQQRQVENAFRLVSLFDEALDEILLEHQFDSPVGIQTLSIPGRELLHRMIETQVYTQMLNERGKIARAYVISRNAFPWADDEGYSECLLPRMLWLAESPDKGLVRTCCELLNLICKHVCDSSADIIIVNFYLGKYITSIYWWMLYEASAIRNFKTNYPYVWKVYKKYRIHIDGWVEDSYPERNFVTCKGGFISRQDIQKKFTSSYSAVSDTQEKKDKSA
jgi:hypothetical protein